MLVVVEPVVMVVVEPVEILPVVVEPVVIVVVGPDQSDPFDVHWLDHGDSSVGLPFLESLCIQRHPAQVQQNRMRAPLWVALVVTMTADV